MPISLGNLDIYDIRKERIFNPDSLRLEIQSLTDFLCSNKIEILNVAGTRKSRGLRLDADDVALFSLFEWFLERGPKKHLVGRDGGGASRLGEGRVGDRPLGPATDFLAISYFRLVPVG
jgi:hypothetical protein